MYYTLFIVICIIIQECHTQGEGTATLLHSTHGLICLFCNISNSPVCICAYKIHVCVCVCTSVFVYLSDATDKDSTSLQADIHTDRQFWQVEYVLQSNYNSSSANTITDDFCCFYTIGYGVCQLCLYMSSLCLH